MNREAMLRRFDGIRTYRRGGYETPHKALVLLYALAKVQAGTRWLAFRAVNEPLKKLIGHCRLPSSGHLDPRYLPWSRSWFPVPGPRPVRNSEFWFLVSEF